MNLTKTDYIFASCPKGLEYLLAEELKNLDAQNVKETVAGVYFSGDLNLIYRCCLWSRVANRIFYPLIKGVGCKDVDDLYQHVRSIDWQNHFTTENTFAVEFAGQLVAGRSEGAVVDSQARVHQRYWRQGHLEHAGVGSGTG